MRPIRKKLVLDQDARPVAVLVDYEDWLEIERALKPIEGPQAPQDRCRDEWP